MLAMDKLNSSPQAALRAFAGRDFRDWRGLAPNTSLTDVAAVLEVDDWSGAGSLGSERREATWVNAAVEGFEHAVRVWLDENLVLLLDAESPTLATELPDLLRALGTPEAKLDSYLGTFPIPESEWVYPGRGLTLYVNPANGILLRLVVFAPTTLEVYRQHLRLDLQMRRLPLSEDRLREMS
jgi:hypothetical protein